MSSWFKSFGTLHHGFGGRWKLGSLAPAEEFDEAVTKAQLDAVGKGFPFTGDATIDGTLNIDFTGTLDFYSGDSLELVNDPVVQGVTKGDMIGTLYKEGDSELFSGVIDGVNDVFGGLAEVGIKVHTTNFKDLNTGDLVTANVGRLILPPELGGGESIFISPMQAVFVESTGTFSEYAMRAQREIGTDDSDFTLLKVVDDGVNPQLLGISMNSNSTAMQFRNTLLDNTASVYRFEDNNDDVLFDIRNNGLFVGPNIPTADPLEFGQIWLDGDTLKVSAGAP